MTISMNGLVKRREFLAGSALAAAAGRAWGQGADEAKMKRITVMTLSFSSIIKTPEATSDDPKRTVDILDLADIVAQRFGIHNLELQHTHVASTEPAYFAEFRNRLKKAKSQISQIVLSLGQLSVSSADLVSRLETIDLTKAWIDHAVTLGCPRVMVIQGSLAPEVRQTAIEALKTIAAYGKTKNVSITMENRGGGGGRAGAPGASATASPGAGGPGAGGPGGASGQAGARGAGGQGRRAGQTNPPSYSAPWGVLVEVCKASGTYVNPDLQYFADDADRKTGLPVMYRMTAGTSHVKYSPGRFDTAECIRISKQVGYKGLYSIEALGASDPYAAAKTILDVILANM